MASKKRYNELKNAGLCTKCAKPRGDSPSLVRCIECYEKYAKHAESKQKAVINEKNCIQCDESCEDLLCEACKQKNIELKANLSKRSSIVSYKENNEHCKSCNSPINTLGTLCQKCFATIDFTKLDALSRYGMICIRCKETDPDRLKLVSHDISKPMKKSGPALHKQVCFNKKISDEYKILCFTCYRNEDLNYVRSLRNLFMTTGSTYPSDDSTEINDDYIDINEYT